MRDLDRWKDKVELQLDGRQVFFLFFGSAICACLIFVLGVVVGKKVEARALAHATSPVEDPLAALDELGNAEELTFHDALVADKGQKGGSKAEKPKVAAFAGAAAAASAVAEHGVPTPAEPTPPVPAIQVVPAKPTPATAAKPSLPPEAAMPPKGHFTLQLNAFQTKSEANDFLKKLRDAGYKPYLTESQVAGKGLMYRVRLGDYSTKEAAMTAKETFERKQKIVAYVAKL